MPSVYKFFLEKLGNQNAETYVGKPGDIWFDPDAEELRLRSSDGSTPGGSLVQDGSGEGNGYTGSAGATGFTGSVGTIGYSGSRGVIGFTGSRGVVGFTGSAGSSGDAITFETTLDLILSNTVHSNNEIITTENGKFSYRVLGVGANTSDIDVYISNESSVLYEVLPDSDGYYYVESIGFYGNTVSGDVDRLQAASDQTPYLKFKSKTYLFATYDAVVGSWNSAHKYACIRLTNAAHWRTVGKTTLKIDPAIQTGGQLCDIALVLGIGDEVTAAGNTLDWSAPNFTMDESAVQQGFGAALALYGANRVDVSNMTFKNYNPVRIGGDDTNQTEELFGGPVYFEDGVGTFAMGGKPGGIVTWNVSGVYIRRARGGLNVECEVLDEVPSPTAPITRIAHIDRVIGYDLDDERQDPPDAGIDSPIEFVKVADGTEQLVIGTIELHTSISANTGREVALSAKPGQNDRGFKKIHCDTIIISDGGSAVRLELGANTASDLGVLDVGSISSSNSASIVSLISNRDNGTNMIKSVIVGNVMGSVQNPHNTVAGTAILIDSDPSSTVNNTYPPFVDTFRLNSGYLSSVQKRSFDVRGAHNFHVSNFTVDEHLSTSVTGDYAGTVYNVIEADHIVLTDVMLRGFATTNAPLELRPRISCRLQGLTIEGNSTGSCLFFAGAGAVIIDSCRFTGATNAINIRPGLKTFDANTDVDTSTNELTVSSHGYRHGDEVLYTEGDTAIGGLTDGEKYFVILVNGNTIKLSSTLRGSEIDITSEGTGTASLKRAIDIVATNNKNECSTFIFNPSNALSVDESGTF